MLYLHILALNQDHLDLIAALAAHDDAFVELAGFHPEIGIELPADRRIRHGKSDVLQRTNRHGPSGMAFLVASIVPSSGAYSTHCTQSREEADMAGKLLHVKVAPKGMGLNDFVAHEEG